MSDRPRVLFVGRWRYRLPLPRWLAKVGCGRGAARLPGSSVPPRRATRFAPSASSSPRRRRPRARRAPLLPPPSVPGASGALRLPARRNLCVRSPSSARRLAGRKLAGDRTPVIVEVHGDWRTFTRLCTGRRPGGARGSRRPRRPVRGSPRRRDPRCLVPPLGSWRRCAGALRAPSSPLSATSPPSPTVRRFRSRRDRPLRRRAGGLQEHRRPGSSATAPRPGAGEPRLVVVGRGSRKPVVELPRRRPSRPGRPSRVARSRRGRSRAGRRDGARAAVVAEGSGAS